MRYKNVPAIVIVLILLFGGLFVGMSQENLSPANVNHAANTETSVIPRAYLAPLASNIPPVSQLMVINTINLSLFHSPFGAAFDSTNGYVYATNFLSNNVSVINGTTNTVIKNISVGSHPQGAAFDSSNGYIYVTNSGSNNVSIINGATNTVIKNISVGLSPFGAAFDSSNGYVYVTNYFSCDVSVIDGNTNTVIKNISVGSHPVGATFDSSNGYVFVTNFNSKNVSVINGAKNIVIENISVGIGSAGGAFDSSNGYVYVGIVTGAVAVLGYPISTNTSSSSFNLYAIIGVLVAAIVAADISIVLIKRKRRK